MIFPPFTSSRDAGGQIQRHFVHGLRKVNSHILCIDSNHKTTSNNVYQVKENKVWYGIFRLLHRYNWATTFMVPDQLYFSWKKRATKEAINVVSQNHIDYIHSVNNPCTSHLIAYQVKKKTGLPWIAQFYDPWHNNPFRRFRCKYSRAKDAKYEKLIADKADAILVPNESLAKYWIDTYGDTVSNKLHIIPFVTEHPMGDFHSSTKGDKLVVSHIGTLSKERNSIDFIQAVSQLVDELPIFRDKIQVNYIGSVSEEEIQLIRDLHLCDIFNIVGTLNEQQCKMYYEESSLFLIVDINVTPNVFYPSKMLKYFCYKKPILAIVTAESTVEEEMRKTKNYAFKYGDINGIKEFLAKALVDYKSIANNDCEYWRRFMIENVEKQYMQIVNKILKQYE